MVLPKLAIANLYTRKIRAALTTAAIAMSVCLVVAITGGYASAYAAAQKMLATYMGTTDAEITRHNEMRGLMSDHLIDLFKTDPDVLRADGRLELSSRLLMPDGTAIVGRPAQIVAIQRPQDTRVETLKMEQGNWFDSSDSDDAVIDQVAQQKLNVNIGGYFFLPGVNRQLKLRVVGVVHKPGILATAVQTVYMPLQTLQKFMLPDDPRQITRIMIDLRPGTDEQAFVTRWRAKLGGIDTDLRIRLSSENRKQMDRNLQGLHAVSLLAGAVSMLAASFIVFSTLSMGVAERQRTLGMLRAIGALRMQLGLLVVMEGLALSVVGLVIGVAAGIACVEILAWRFSSIFAAGAVISGEGIAYAAIGSGLTAVAASLLPALRAMRTTPLEAMTPLAKPTRRRSMFISAIVGLFLIAIDPLILALPLNRSVQFYGHYTIGLAGILVGFFLLAPLGVWLIELFVGPIVSEMLGLRFVLLRQQLTSSVWRAAGTCAALMVGLAILIVTQTQGTTAIQGWKLPDKFPDIFIFSSPGLTSDDQAKLATVKGISELMPVAIASPQFGTNIFALAGAAIMPDATMFFGIDPDKALDMMELDFREGNPADAKRLLKLGKHVIVTQEYKQLRGLGVGDKISLKTHSGAVVDFTIAGVVWSPGIDVITSLHDMGRQFDQRTAASLFGTLDDAREYFGVDRIHLFAANLDTSASKEQLLAQIQNTLHGWGLDAGDVRQIKYGIQRGMTNLLKLVSTIAYAAMLVASLGVTNTIMASIRSRRWQFGIMRSIGVTRGQLMKLVLAEAILLGIVGIVLGLAAGFELSVDAWRGWGLFFGYSPTMVVPWGAIAIGVSVVMTVSVIASVWPALHVARAEPLSLLQGGRAAT